jgi:hypothetical protein
MQAMLHQSPCNQSANPCWSLSFPDLMDSKQILLAEAMNDRYRKEWAPC